MIRKFLCKIGLHLWKDVAIKSLFPLGSQCKHCGTIRVFVGWGYVYYTKDQCREIDDEIERDLASTEQKPTT